MKSFIYVLIIINLFNFSNIEVFAKEKVVPKNTINKIANQYISEYFKKNPNIKEWKEGRKSFLGDLNNDGEKDLIVQYNLDEKDGGNGTGFPEIAIFLQKNGNFTYLTSINSDAGGRGGFNVKKINMNIIFVEVKEYAENDGMCCPSLISQRKYKLVKDKIFQIKN